MRSPFDDRGYSDRVDKMHSRFRRTMWTGAFVWIFIVVVVVVSLVIGYKYAVAAPISISDQLQYTLVK